MRLLKAGFQYIERADRCQLAWMSAKRIFSVLLPEQPVKHRAVYRDDVIDRYLDPAGHDNDPAVFIYLFDRAGSGRAAAAALSRIRLEIGDGYGVLFGSAVRDDAQLIADSGLCILIQFLPLIC